MNSPDPHKDEQKNPQNAASQGTNHQAAMASIRSKMEQVASEYSAGKLNSAQFNAIYRHYIEKRLIIEKLIERNPETDAWKTVAEQGQTTFLRSHFEARPIFYMVFKHKEHKPINLGGTLPKKVAPQINAILQQIWKMDTPRKGLARKNIGDGKWIVLALGDFAMTVAVFALQPSTTQINRIRDMHMDFERANHLTLQRSLMTSRLVFPQRALIEE